MSHHAAHITADVAGRLGQGMLMGHFALQDAMRTVKRAQRDDRHAVVRLADRLDEVRDAEAAALNRAARAEAELAHARQQIRELEILLDRQTRLVQGFREICGV
ncbi:hypothetical protein MMB17_05600 [Methylobacterium organophilum]|uniref:hypothetical protein n=1 Tax=Methylobacterium organophilum TaxID=410 RepID=UPI001F138828|nr:hypothetical protein [Methylobacterium organophilum]UMY18791.1 hypothetical protein MMB17_05600 [Methylobacterium organophilum]